MGFMEKEKTFTTSMTAFIKNVYAFFMNFYTRCTAIAKENTTLYRRFFMREDDPYHIHKTPPISRLILWGAFIFVIIFITWAKFAVLDEVTVGIGKVIPSSQVQIIQNLEGGIIKEILVREAEVVQKGQILLLLDDTRFNAVYQEGVAKANALQIKIARLTAQLEDKPFVVSEELTKALPEIARTEHFIYESRKNELERLQHGLELVQKELTLTKPLVKEGAASAVEVLRLERQVNELQNQLNTFRSRTLDELNNARTELATLTQSNLALKDRLERTVIRSPVKGIVKQIKISTTGGIAQPGMEIMQIVPLEDTLLIEAQVRPADIGFIRPGLPATVKITAFDYSIYGGLNGKVESISADTITNDKGESFYLIRVRTQKNYLGTQGKPLFIIPGMTATVDILTGKKSVLDYLLKPILKAKETALRER